MAGQRSMGTTLTLTGEASDPDVVLANLASIGEQSSEAEEVDTTTLDSPGGNKEFVQGAKDGGTVSVVANNVQDGQAEILDALFQSGATREWVTTFNGGATLTYNAYISKRAFGEATTDGLDTFSFDLRVSGTPVYEEA